MIEYNRAELAKEARKLGFVRDTFEKALRLKEILKFFNSHEFLAEHLVLKGGTAINFLIFNQRTSDGIMEMQKISIIV